MRARDASQMLGVVDVLDGGDVWKRGYEEGPRCMCVPSAANPPRAVYMMGRYGYLTNSVASVICEHWFVRRILF